MRPELKFVSNDFFNFSNVFAAITHEKFFDICENYKIDSKFDTEIFYRISISKYDEFLSLLGNKEIFPEALIYFNKKLNLLIRPSISYQTNTDLYITLSIFYNQKNTNFNTIQKEFISKLKSYEFNGIKALIEWWFPTKHGIEYRRIVDIEEFVVMDEAYPEIIEGVSSYLNRFLDSSEKVLLMLGAPGTGKSKLIKELIRIIKKRRFSNLNPKDSENTIETPTIENKNEYITYTTAEEVLNSDNFFISFLTGDSSLMVLEDLDLNLNSRVDGNSFMQKLLNASDGLVGAVNKKIVLSSNIQNEKNIDSALLRPGRCFDVLKHRRLTREEALILAERLGTNLPEGLDTFSLAEIYNNKSKNIIKAGFN